MKLRTRLIAIALAVAGAAAVAAAPASASRSFSLVGGGRTIGGIPGDLEFIGDSGVRIATDATLSGSLHSLIAKTSGSLLGVITTTRFANCNTNLGMSCTVSTLGTIHVKLSTFTGTLPRITSTTVYGDVPFRVVIDGGTPSCLYRGDLYVVSSGRTGTAEFTIERQQLVERRNIATLTEARGEEVFRRCPRAAEITGSINAEPDVTIRLH